MKKTDRFDQSLAAYGNSLSSAEIFHVVQDIFGFDLDQVPLLTEGFDSQRSACDAYLEELNGHYTREQICRIVNELYGVNLGALCALEDAQLSLFAKGRWVMTASDDLFVIFSGDGDRLARVFTTPYYVEKTGDAGAPAELQTALLNMGYTMDASGSHFLYQTDDDLPVPDAFKGQTIGAVRHAIAALTTTIH